MKESKKIRGIDPERVVITGFGVTMRDSVKCSSAAGSGRIVEKSEDPYAVHRGKAVAIQTSDGSNFCGIYRGMRCIGAAYDFVLRPFVTSIKRTDGEGSILKLTERPAYIENAAAVLPIDKKSIENMVRSSQSGERPKIILP